MKLTINRKIEAPLDEVWELISDYANICKYHPSMKNSFLIINPNDQGVGATRQCDFGKGKYIREKAIEWKEKSHYTAEIYDSTFPIRAAKSTLGVQRIDDFTTRTYLKMDISKEYIIMKPFMYIFFRFNAGKKILRNLEEAAVRSASELDLVGQ